MFKRMKNHLEHRIMEISEANQTAGPFSLAWILAGLSKGYGLGVRFRLWLFAQKILRSRKLPCPVISIGNISVGGTGKTPMAICLAEMFEKAGKKAAVISRGYKGTYKEASLIVSDGKTLFASALEAGDEPYMMAKRKMFPVVVGKDRFKAGQMAVNAFDPDLLILDDAFQHLKLARDVNLLLFDYSDPLGNGRLLPAGRLRESFEKAAGRADALIFTRSPGSATPPVSMRDFLNENPGLPSFYAQHDPFVLCRMPEGENENLDLASLSGKRALLVSGLARNRSFSGQMRQNGVKVLEHLEFKDHYRYKESDFLKINHLARKVKAEIIITTEKDWAKFPSQLQWETPLAVIGIRIRFQNPEKFALFLNKKLTAANE